MRYLVAAALVLSPLMVHAQTASSAPTTQLAVMQSGVHAPRTMMSSASASAADLPHVDSLRVSTGVVSPKLLHTTPILSEAMNVHDDAQRPRSADVSMIVESNGKPTDLKIVKSAGADLDSSILEAVSQFRFRPGSVSGLAIAVPLTLHLQILPLR